MFWQLNVANTGCAKCLVCNCLKDLFSGGDFISSSLEIKVLYKNNFVLVMLAFYGVRRDGLV